MATRRREFLRQLTLAGGAAAQPLAVGAEPARQPATPRSTIEYPRVFRGRQLATIAFPLGGVGAGSISLGGRGQLRDWEIFNRADKGNNLSYAFPCIRVQDGAGKAVARVLEARYLPPYEGQNGLGWRNAPGLTRLARATFTGEFPFARVEFSDPRLPVRITLEAFSPFIPHEPDESGLPATVLRYRVSNPGRAAARVTIAWCVQNPVGPASIDRPVQGETRKAEFVSSGAIQAVLMTNPGLAADHPEHGSFVLAITDPGDGAVNWSPGWARSRWWNAPMLFWDGFKAAGKLPSGDDLTVPVPSLSLEREIAPAKEAEFPFVMAWHFPNRTPERCGWSAPAGEAKTLIGNWYATRFRDAWAVARHLGERLPELEKKTRLFAGAMRDSTLPGAVKDAATANLSTLVSTTCFRTADGEFHGFEGVNDKSGCCYGNCTHVWNYEVATSHLFPSLARSLREAAFGYSMDAAGAMHFRQLLPDGRQRSGFAAADGQMGQILHAYLDWRLTGDRRWLLSIWPRVKKALEFAWIPGGWDADQDGVMDGVQHNTYDVEFFGPNPQCGIYYLGGLRAGEELAKAAGDDAAAARYRTLFERGRAWIDANLFNGEYYVQKVRGVAKREIAPALRSTMGSDDTEKPEYQVGEGCLIDQLVGQYLADIAGLGPLVDPKHIRKALESIRKYNYRETLEEHDSVQRIYAVGDEPALLICDYGQAPRPRIPFPYYAEAWTGLEYMAGAQMMYAGMLREGVEAFENVRRRHDGERRNPWDEPECGHHYARALAAWSGVIALSGFLYDAAAQRVDLTPRMPGASVRSFWSAGPGWGVCEVRRGTRASVRVLHGSLACRELSMPGGGVARVLLNGAVQAHSAERRGDRVIVRFREPALVREGGELIVEQRVAG